MKKSYLVFALTVALLSGCTGGSGNESKGTPTAENVVATFINWDGAELQKVTVKKGETPAYTAATPTKAEDTNYTYTFKGWNPAITAISVDTTFTATYEETAKQKSVKKSELRKAFIDASNALYNNFQFSESMWTVGEKITCYEFCNDWDNFESNYKQEDALNDVEELLKDANFAKVSGPTQFTWEDGDLGYESFFKLGETITLNAATYVDIVDEEKIIVLQYDVYASAGVTFINDDGDLKDKTVTWDFSGLNDLKDYGKDGLSGFLSDEKPSTNFVKYYNSLQDDDLLTSIYVPADAKVQIMPLDSKAGRINRITLGSSSYYGSLTFNFACPVTSIEITAQGYCKYIAYNDCYSQDANACLYINDNTHPVDLKLNEIGVSEEPKIVTDTMSFDSAVQSVTFFNLDACERVFLLGMKVNYKAA